MRSPLPAPELPAGGLWTALRVVDETGSTNADVAAAARDGAAEGLVVVAEHQRAGRGRGGRDWSSPPRAGLTVSMLLRPGEAVPPYRRAWLPLLTGVALAEVVNQLAGVRASLKWPNDLLVGGRKCAGILAEAAGDAVVVGVGLNVTQRADELPPPATSLLLAGARTTDRGALLHGLLDALGRWYEVWQQAGGDAEVCGLRTAYLGASATVGQPVRALLPDGTAVTGNAATVDADGRLVLRTATNGTRTLAAGDIVHLRPARP